MNAQGANRWAHHQGGRKKDPEKVRMATELAASGMSRREIAVYFGVSRGTIDYWLTKPVAKVVSPRPVFVPSHFALALVPGAAKELRLFRRGDCPRLRQCEIEFIDKHGSAQGECPADCPGP